MAPSPPMFSLLTADDEHWLAEGSHQQLHRKLGAHVFDGGVYFAVWAPSAHAVSVIGDWNGWDGATDRLTLRGTCGIWEGVIANAAVGARYKFRIETTAGEFLDKADPVARFAEVSPATASIIWQSNYEWNDWDWLASRAAKQAPTAPISIYEVHLGSWQRNGEKFLTYRELAPRLAEHVRSLGFTHVELMPVMEHPYYGSWGYQVTGFFAPTSRYGTPDDFRAMIDILHAHDLSVILDWVPAHFPTDAHGLGTFDGTALYEHADPRRGFHPDWTSFIFNYGRHEVRSFLVSSARSWFDDFHVDGLRVDGVASMLYRDYSREPGEWIADEDGSNHDRDAISLLQAVNDACHSAHPGIATFAEESTSWPGVTAPTQKGGLGFSYKWDLGWMNDTLRYFAQDPIYRRHHHDLLTFRSVYAADESFVLPLSHDEVVHEKGALLAKFPGDDWQQRATLRLLLGYQFTTPGKKLLFQGAELGTRREWQHEGELEWGLLDNPANAGLSQWLTDLNHAYRSIAALHVGDCQPLGMQWLIGDDYDNSVYVFVRRGSATEAPALVMLNATPVPRFSYHVGVARAGVWRERLNSDAATYGGSNVGNLGEVQTQAIPHQGLPHRLAVTLPPLACVVLLETV